MLPFNEEGEGRASDRIYTCFVCGRGFKSIEEYKNHIVEEHAEGREYILCPLDRCKCPIRDLKSHFKVFHAHEEMPKGVQLRAFIWSDVKEPKNRQRKVAFKSGDFISHKNGKKLHYRSGYELDVYKCLEEMPEVVKFEAEPFGIDYFYGAENRKYYPDLIIYYETGEIEIWEIKPKSQVNHEINCQKWDSCAAFCTARGWQFVVKTEIGIKLLKEHVRRQKNA